MLRDASDARPDWVFLCGTARGGTTLLARLLDGHPALVVLPWDSRVYPDLMDRSLTRIIVSLSEWTGSYELPAALAGPVAGVFAFGGRRALAARLARWAGGSAAAAAGRGGARGRRRRPGRGRPGQVGGLLRRPRGGHGGAHGVPYPRGEDLSVAKTSSWCGDDRRKDLEKTSGE